jgi:hypothetical protein
MRCRPGGARLGAALENDPALRELAHEYGYRTGGDTKGPETWAARGVKVPEVLVDVIDPPSFEWLERMTAGIEARFKCGTAIYSALATAEELARKEQEADPGRLVSIVLLTDGENNAGLKPREFSERFAGGLPARIFPILFGEADVAGMQEIAQASGGREFDGRKLQLGQVFKEIRGYQ